MNYAVKRMQEVKNGKHVLTTRQLKYLQGRMQGMNKEEAKRYANYSEKSNTSDIERNGAISNGLMIALKNVGLTDEVLANKLVRGLNLKKTNYYAYNGRVTDERTVPDNETQHKYIRTILEVRGDLSNANNVSVNLGVIGLQAPESPEKWNSEAEKK